MESKANEAKKWHCFSLVSLKGAQFVAEVPSSIGVPPKPLEIHYYMSRPLTFGSLKKGVASFIITSYGVRDSLSKSSRKAIEDCLKHLRDIKEIESFNLKEIDSGSVRITATFVVRSTEHFAVKMFQTTIRIFKELNVPNDSSVKTWLDQFKFDCECYICDNGMWLYEREYFLRQLGSSFASDLIDESVSYRMDIQDLF